MRHKKFLRQLEKQKNMERQDMFEQQASAQNKTKAFKDQAARQREKIRGLKTHDVAEQNEQAMAA